MFAANNHSQHYENYSYSPLQLYAFKISSFILSFTSFEVTEVTGLVATISTFSKSVWSPVGHKCFASAETSRLLEVTLPMTEI